VPFASPTLEAALTSSDTVLWEQSGPVGRITLNRPETLNAWIAEFGAALKDIVNGPAADESVRAVVITGAGRGFSSGADL
jgi:2-(1,2-epoxy-1,2-dihydrophenyl)acetyl-CoA isomerase